MYFDRKNSPNDLRLSKTRNPHGRIEYWRDCSKNPDTDLLVTKSVYLNKSDAEKLKEMNEQYGVKNIYFQATPSAPKTGLKDVLNKFDLS